MEEEVQVLALQDRLEDAIDPPHHFAFAAVASGITPFLLFLMRKRRKFVLSLDAAGNEERSEEALTRSSRGISSFVTYHSPTNSMSAANKQLSPPERTRNLGLVQRLNEKEQEENSQGVVLDEHGIQQLFHHRAEERKEDRHENAVKSRTGFLSAGLTRRFGWKSEPCGRPENPNRGRR